MKSKKHMMTFASPFFMSLDQVRVSTLGFIIFPYFPTSQLHNNVFCARSIAELRPKERGRDGGREVVSLRYAQNYFSGSPSPQPASQHQQHQTRKGAEIAKGSGRDRFCLYPMNICNGQNVLLS